MGSDLCFAVRVLTSTGSDTSRPSLRRPRGPAKGAWGVAHPRAFPCAPLSGRHLRGEAFQIVSALHSFGLEGRRGRRFNRNFKHGPTGFRTPPPPALTRLSALLPTSTPLSLPFPQKGSPARHSAKRSGPSDKLSLSRPSTCGPLQRAPPATAAPPAARQWTPPDTTLDSRERIRGFLLPL